MRDEYFWALFGLGWIGFWVVAWMVQQQFRERSRMRLREMAHRERMAALERQVPLPELPDAGDDLQHRMDPEVQRIVLARLALGLGLLALFVGAGICLAFGLSSDRDFHTSWSVGLIPAMGGAGLLLYWLLLSRSPNDGR